MAQPLDTGRLTGRTLGCVRATVIGTEVEDQRLLLGQLGQLLGAVHDPDRQARGIEQGDRLPTARYADVPDGTAGGTGQPVEVGPLGRAERRSDEAGRTPLRITMHGEPAKVPRSHSSPSVRAAIAKPKSRAKTSAWSRSGFSNSSQARSAALITGFRDRPGCSPRKAPCSLWRSWWGVWGAALLTGVWDMVSSKQHCCNEEIINFAVTIVNRVKSNN